MKKGISAVIIVLIICIILLAIFAVLIDRKVINIKKIGVDKEIQVVDNNDKDDNNTKKDNELKDNLGINFVYSLEDDTYEDTIWCGTFNIIWNRLREDLAKKDIIFSEMSKTVINLNKGTFSENDLEDSSYYVAVDYMTPKLKAEIEKGIKEKFNETSDILDSFDFRENSKDYFLYTMLKKVFNFEYKFDILENGKFADKYDDVKYFGIDKNSKKELKEQIDVLYYDSEDSFAIKIHTKENDELVFCKSPNGKSFSDMYNNILDKEKKYTGTTNLKSEEYLKVPNIMLNAKSQVKEVMYKPFSFANGDEYEIDNAIQTIKFELDNAGGKIKSEAAMSLRNTAVFIPEEEKIRTFYLDSEFAIFIVEEGKEHPYFAAKISDITKFQ